MLLPSNLPVIIKSMSVNELKSRFKKKFASNTQFTKSQSHKRETLKNSVFTT